MEQQMDILKRIEAKLDLLLGDSNKPWYPDDSGEWVEHASGVAPDLPGDTQVEILAGGEREDERWTSYADCISNWDWAVTGKHPGDIVAYRIVK